MIQYFDVQIDSPNEYHKKCMEKSEIIQVVESVVSSFSPERNKK